MDKEEKSPVSVKTFTLEEMQAGLLKDLVLIFDSAKRQVEGIFNTESLALDAAIKSTAQSKDENNAFREILRNLKFNPDTELKKLIDMRKNKDKTKQPNRAARRKAQREKKKSSKK